jgi:cell division protein FtsL
MSPPIPNRLYTLFRKRPAASATQTRKTVAVLVTVSAMLVSLVLLRVSRRHRVIRYGYQLAEASSRLRVEEELHRRLLLERSTLTSPERIRTIATGLGMVPVPADRIRVIPRGAR